MGHRDNPARCQTGDDFLRWATRHGGSIENGGRHPKVRFGSQMRPVPHGTLATGTRHALVKWVISLGIVFVLVCALLAYIP